MKTGILSFIAVATFAVAAVSCTKNDTNTLRPAPEWKGATICEDVAVDMNLPVRWGSCNIGADKVTDTGNLFCWGELEPNKDTCSLEKSVYYNPDTKAYNHDGTTMEPEEDIVTVAMTLAGEEGWRVPTVAEFQTLIDSSKVTYAKYKGVTGYVVTRLINKGVFGKPDDADNEHEGNSLFFPLTGYKYNAKVHNKGIQALYWLNELSGEKAKNAFFRYDEARTYSVTAWYAVAVRGVKSDN